MSLPPEQWARVKAVFDAAVALDATERAAYLARACGDDPELRRRVETLLGSHDRAPAFLETPAGALLERLPPTDDLIGRTIGPYRLVERIGAGGMGEVYKAEDSKLNRPVALKLLPQRLATDTDRLSRFHAEAHAASSLNHPHILVIHDFGEMDGRPFIVTEFVEGHTLRKRLQAGPMAVREAVDIAIQVAGALAAAHARGLVHRDIKPENVMLRPDGYVKVLDFGLAKLMASAEVEPQAHTQAGTVMGTPRYMSPEQARGLAVDARSDLWSLGVVLYEMVAGRAPFEGATSADVLAMILEREVEPVARRVSDVPAALAVVLGTALQKDPQRRYQSAAAMREVLEAVDDVPAPSTVPQVEARHAGPSTRRLWIPAIALMLVGLVGGAIWIVTRQTTPPLTSRDAILLADIENKTGDPVFDDTIKTALAVGLEQSPYLRTVAAERVRETLTLMGRPADTRIAGEVAREICEREGAKAMLDGSMASLGSHYVISLEARVCSSGDPLARQQIEVPGKEQVLTRLGAAAGALRATLGESLASIRQYDVPLERATTSSLEALKALSIGNGIRVKKGMAGAAEAIPFFKRAIELDPDFAFAYVNLAQIYGGGYELKPALARQYALGAFERRDRATDLERLSITATYYTVVTLELDKAIETCEVWRQRYPNDGRPSNNVGLIFRSLGRPEEALEAALDSVRRTPDNVNSHENLAMAHLNVNRLAEGRALLERLMERRQIPRGNHGVYDVAFVQGDTAAMQREVDAARARPSDRSLPNSQLGVLTFGGHYRKARELMRAESTAAELRTAAGREALVGNRVEAQRLIGQALAIDSTPPAQAEAAVALAMAGDLVQAQALIQSAAAGSPVATLMNRITLPIARAALELQRGSSPNAIAELQPVLPYDRALAIAPGGPPVPGLTAPYLRGQALWKQRDGPAAAAEFGKLIENRGLLRVNVLFPLAHLGLGRALVVAGDATGAAKEYEEFFRFWKDADPDIPILIAARREYAALPKR